MDNSPILSNLDPHGPYVLPSCYSKLLPSLDALAPQDPRNGVDRHLSLCGTVLKKLFLLGTPPIWKNQNVLGVPKPKVVGYSRRIKNVFGVPKPKVVGYSKAA